MEAEQKGATGTVDPWPRGHEPAAEAFRPHYTFTPRLVGHLACGELAVEPVLGPVRVTEIRHGQDRNAHGETAGDDDFVFVTWRDQHGPGTATGRYPTDRSFEVRMPALEDRLLVRQGIDRAMWLKQEVSDDTARLIATHLHTGERSALHRFALDGSTAEPLLDELDAVARHRRYAREWVDALARYCLAREDTGPIASWTREALAEAERRADQWLTAATVSADDLQAHTNGTRANRRTQHRHLLSRKQITTEIAARLIDAAFSLGLEAGRSRARIAGAQLLLRQHAPDEAA